jgi:hypothetical protein
VKPPPHLTHLLVAGDWSAVDGVLNDAIRAREPSHTVLPSIDATADSFPGAVAVVADKDNILYARAFGNCATHAHAHTTHPRTNTPHRTDTYGIPAPYAPPGWHGSRSPPMELSTLFDMARWGHDHEAQCVRVCVRVG